MEFLFNNDIFLLVGGQLQKCVRLRMWKNANLSLKNVHRQKPFEIICGILTSHFLTQTIKKLFIVTPKAYFTFL